MQISLVIFGLLEPSWICEHGPTFYCERTNELRAEKSPLKIRGQRLISLLAQFVTALAGVLLLPVNQIAAEVPPAPVCEPSKQGSPYIPVDSWIYPAVLRLYSLGYVDHVYLGHASVDARQFEPHARGDRRPDRGRGDLWRSNRGRGARHLLQR